MRDLAWRAILKLQCEAGSERMTYIGYVEPGLFVSGT